MPIVQPANFQQGLVVAMADCLATICPPTTAGRDCGPGVFPTSADLATTADNSADGIILEILADPAAQLDVAFWQVTRQELTIFQHRRHGTFIALGLLPRMFADRAKRIFDVEQATSLQQVKPHLQIAHHEERLIESADSEGPAKHHRARAPDQVALLEQAASDDAGS